MLLKAVLIIAGALAALTFATHVTDDPHPLAIERVGEPDMPAAFRPAAMLVDPQKEPEEQPWARPDDTQVPVMLYSRCPLLPSNLPAQMEHDT